MLNYLKQLKSKPKFPLKLVLKLLNIIYFWKVESRGAVECIHWQVKRHHNKFKINGFFMFSFKIIFLWNKKTKNS